jgi:FtsP/CotA-like multicopper oxidase with cupredoxin domain
MVSTLDATKIPKYKNQLVIPPTYIPNVIKDPYNKGITSHNYVIFVSQFKQQLLPYGFPQTTVFGYGGNVIDKNTNRTINNFRNAPGATFDTISGLPVNIQWINTIKNFNPLPVDPTIHWADPNNLGMVDPESVPPFPPGLAKAEFPVPIVTHLHGGENNSVNDGHPDAWFTNKEDKVGSEFITSIYQYPNKQPSTTLWYHDHTLGITRLNVLMGLAGFYLIRDYENPLDIPGKFFPDKKYEIPIVIQDRSFYTDGSFCFPTVGINPDIHPYWMPEFFGDTIMVNGKIWPNLNVDRCQYRFRLLNGSNARFYDLNFSNHMEFIQIGGDGGYLPKPVMLTSLVLSPGERADIIIDFSSLFPGTKLILENHASAPFPSGDEPDPETVAQVMQFTVSCFYPLKSYTIPTKLNDIPKLVPNTPKRTLVLFEVQGENGPIEVLLNGQNWSAPISECPLVGSTEKWEIVNLTEDAHPIHLHLVNFEIESRQAFEAEKYTYDWIDINGMPPLNHPTITLPVNNYLIGNPLPPDDNERGFKDTVRANPGEVTTFIVRFAPQDSDPDKVKPGTNLFPFNPSLGPGYVWHCHILDHEDNEMMRPYKVILNKDPM